ASVRSCAKPYCRARGEPATRHTANPQVVGEPCGVPDRQDRCMRGRLTGVRNSGGEYVTATDQLGAPQTDAQAWVPPTWEEIVEQHSARVYRLAYRLTGQPHDAQDLTHDVFIRVFRSLHSYQPGTFEGWLHRITTNVFLDKMRRKQRIRFDALSDESAARLASREMGPEGTFDATHFDDDV